MGTLIGLVVICAVFAMLSDVFLTERNLVNILQQSSINSCVAIGMTMVIISGRHRPFGRPGRRLRRCSRSVLAGRRLSGFAVDLRWACGRRHLRRLQRGSHRLCGGLQPFIVTLGSLSVFRALALIYTGGNPILGVPNEFRRLFASEISDLPSSGRGRRGARRRWPSVLLARTPLGEYIFAVGGNEEAARISGVPIARTKIAAYAMSGFLAALAAIILVARLGAAEPTLGNLWELEAIAASAIGGASLMGGKGSIIGTILGAMVLGAMRNGLTLLNVQAFYQLLATGIIIILAMLIDRLTRGRE